MRKLNWLFFGNILAITILGTGCINTQVERKLECVVPANPGGGFDITCRTLAESLEKSELIEKPMRISYLPGGVGAVAFNRLIENRSEDNGAIAAISTGSTLNIALDKFSGYTALDVRWLGAIAADYGVIAVRADAPWQNLGDLMRSLKDNPDSVVFGASGSIGSQDWMKAALLTRAAGVDPKNMRFAAYEGGGEALISILGGQTDVCPCDLSEMKGHLESGKYRILAVLSDDRLSGDYSKYPTAIEQGYDVSWPVWRGFYLPPNIKESDYQWWVALISELVETEEFAIAVKERGLQPYIKIGPEYELMVTQQVKEFRELAEEVGLK